MIDMYNYFLFVTEKEEHKMTRKDMKKDRGSKVIMCEKPENLKTTHRQESNCVFRGRPLSTNCVDFMSFQTSVHQINR